MRLIIISITIAITILDFDSNFLLLSSGTLPALPRKAHSLGTEHNSHMDEGGEVSRSEKLETFKFFIYSLVCSWVNSLF